MRRQLRWKGSLASLLQGRVRVATLDGPRRSALRPAGSQGGAHPAIAISMVGQQVLAFRGRGSAVPRFRSRVETLRKQGQDLPPRLPFGKG